MKQNQYFSQSISPSGETSAEKLEEMAMSIKEFALCIPKPEKVIVAILNGEGFITFEMAVQFENVTQIPAHFWMSYQKYYDAYLARKQQ